jgi:aldehyde dehydrogenase (NAD+)
MPLHDAATVTVGGSPSTNGGSQAAADRRLLIDGQLLTTSRVFASVNPATGDVIGHAPDAGIEEAQQAIAAARRAFDTTTWSTDAAFRVRCLEQLHQALLDHAEELRELTIAEVGATRALTQGAQLDEPIKIVRYYADLLRDYSMTEAGLEEFLERKTIAVPAVAAAGPA